MSHQSTIGWLTQPTNTSTITPFQKKFSTRSGGATADLVLNTAPKKVRQLPFAEIYTEKQGKDLLKRLEESHPSWKKHTKKVSGKAPHGYLVSLF